MSPPTRLAELQRWMLNAVSSASETHVEQTLLASRQQTVAERLAVYQNAYFVRLVECLHELFPVLSATIGKEDFGAFAAGYLERHPPASYTLNHLAHRFPEYLAETRPDIPSPDWPDFLVELARVEHAIDQVFDGPGIEDLPPLDVASLASLSPEELLDVRFTPAPCLRTFALEFPINDYYGAVRRNESPVWPGPAKTYLAITRREYVVRRVPVEEAEFRVLDALVKGHPLGEALAATPTEPTPAQVQAWFASWGRLGLLR